MTPQLCHAFVRLAHETHDRLKAARTVGHQLLEETLTDLIVLELKRLHPREIYCQTFTKPQEGINGADWEWWLSDPTRSRWLGLRVQANVLELKSDTFAHLHYRPKRGRAYQSTRLKKAAEQDGLIPLHCMYAHPPATATGWTRHGSSEAYGCALTSVKEVERLRRRGKSLDFVSVMSKTVPWNMLVCIGSAWSSDGRSLTLPGAVAGLLMEDDPPFGLDRDEAENADREVPLRPGIRGAPPSDVSVLMEGQAVGDVDKSLRGVLVVQGPHIDSRPPERWLARQGANPWDEALGDGSGRGVSPLRGVGLLRCASSHRLPPPSRPLTGCHPSREHGKAGGAGRDHDSGPFPCPGIAGSDSLTLRVNEARLAN